MKKSVKLKYEISILKIKKRRLNPLDFLYSFSNEVK